MSGRAISRRPRPSRGSRQDRLGAGVLSLRAALPLHHGGAIDACEIGYELFGTPARPVAVVLGGISASRHVAAHPRDPRAGWWEPVIGGGRAIDTARFRILSIDYLGGPGKSTGPHTRPGLPAVDTRDQAHALAAVLDHLGVSRVRAVVGASYGGMVALAFAALYPRRVAHVVAIGAAHRAHPMATALRAVQRDVVRLGLRTGQAAPALSLARALGVATYRSADEFATRFDNRPKLDSGSARFPVQDYLDHCGERFAASFPPECFLRLSESIDLHDVAPESIRVPATLVSVDRDSVAPPWQVRELAARLGAPARIVDVHSIYGHDAFLKEAAEFSGLLRDVLASAQTRGGAR